MTFRECISEVLIQELEVQPVRPLNMLLEPFPNTFSLLKAWFLPGLRLLQGLAFRGGTRAVRERGRRRTSGCLLK